MKKQEINWQKINNLLPVIVQHATTCEVLMLQVYESGGVGENLGGEESNVLFPYEESPVDKGGNLRTFLNVVDMSLDCDNDTLLILANPIGATCHTGEDSCFHRFHACLRA